MDRKPIKHRDKKGSKLNDLGTKNDCETVKIMFCFSAVFFGTVSIMGERKYLQGSVIFESEPFNEPFPV